MDAVRWRLTREWALSACLALVVAVPSVRGQEIIPQPDPDDPAAPRAAAPARPYGITQIPGRYVITFVPGTPPADRAAEARQAGLQVIHNFVFSDSLVVQAPNEQALQGLNRSRSVLEIRPDEAIGIAAPPNRPPKAPNNLIASVSGADVSLAWNDRANNEEGFSVQRCAGSGCSDFGDISGALPPDTSGYVDAGLADGVYRYQVVAFNSDGVSDPSNAVEATVSTGGGGDPPPPPPDDPPPADGAVRGTSQILSYAVQRVGRPVAGSTGLGIGVAVLDTGLDYLHPDLQPAPDDPGVVDPIAGAATGTSFNALNPGASCQDVYGHGTHVGGLVGAVDDNGGIVGVAPQATLYCVQLGDTFQFPLTNLQAGLEWVLLRHDQVTPPIKVVNLSLGAAASGSETQQAIAALIDALYEAGVVTVAAAGNDPTLETSQTFPANHPDVISVAGTSATDGINTCGAPSGWVQADTVFAGGYKGTTDGPNVTISAPAEERADLIPFSSGCIGLIYGVVSTALTTVVDAPPEIPDLYTRKIPTSDLGPVEARGTSFSAALVSGVMARIYQQKLEAQTLVGTSADVSDARATLVNSADRVGEAPLDHPWAGQVADVIYTFDGVREGIAQAPMPAP